MASVVAEPCINVKDASCVAVCPVDCIYSSDEDTMYYINLDECIDCGSCEPECPVTAIFAEDELPAQWTHHAQINAHYFAQNMETRAVMYRSALFTGCAAERDGAPPVHHATIALARAMRLELWEAPASGCCGARPDHAVSAPDLRRALAPLHEGEQQGLEVVCLSPACRRVVATHVATGDEQSGGRGTGSESHVEGHRPHVRDVVHVLTQADGLERLRHAVTNPLAPLRVALHGACHADHLPPPPARPQIAPDLPATREHPALLARRAVGATTWRARGRWRRRGLRAETRRLRPGCSDDDYRRCGAARHERGRPCATVHVRHAWTRHAPGAAPQVRCLTLAAFVV